MEGARRSARLRLGHDLSHELDRELRHDLLHAADRQGPRPFQHDDRPRLGDPLPHRHGGERRWHLISASFVGFLGLAGAGFFGSSYWAIAAMSLAIVGIYGSRTSFW